MHPLQANYVPLDEQLEFSTPSPSSARVTVPSQAHWKVMHTRH